MHHYHDLKQKQKSKKQKIQKTKNKEVVRFKAEYVLPIVKTESWGRYIPHA